MSGFAVIDLAATGFAYTHGDRFCEIGVVLVGLARAGVLVVVPVERGQQIGGE